MTAELPPAIILGIDTPIGLSMVRELGRHGVPVYGIAGSRRALGLRSRYLRRGWLRPNGADEVVRLINDIAGRTGARLLLAISEADIFMLREREAQLPGVALLMPTADKLRLVTDKLATARIAEGLGIPVPQSAEATGAADVDRLAEGVRFPVILKWRDPNLVLRRLSPVGLSFHKAEYCYSPESLRRALHRYDPVGVYPVVQSFCPGHGIGHMIFMHDGEAVLAFRHRRRHEWPPEGGISTECESLEVAGDRERVDRSVALLRAIGWEGPAMVEYRYDPQTDRAVLMEVNGRFWGSLPLAFHAGAPFAWFTYSVLGLGTVPEAPTYRSGLVCRFLIPETRRLLTVLLRRGRIQNTAMRFSPGSEIAGYLGGFLSPRTRYYVIWWRDPWPAVADGLSVLGIAAGKAWRAARKRIPGPGKRRLGLVP